MLAETATGYGPEGTVPPSQAGLPLPALPANFLPRFVRVVGDQVVSPSQLSMWDRCNRKWGLRYIVGLKDPGSAASERGQRIHKLLEDYAEKGTYPSGDTLEEKVARELLPFAPPPFSARSEGNFWLEIGGVRFRGFKDLEYVEGGPQVRLPAAGLAPGERLIIQDWKTTSDLRWAKTPEDLKKDPQALLYAADSLTRWRASSVDLRWVYGTTGEKTRTRRVEQTLSFDEVACGLESVLLSAEQLVLAKRNTRDVKDLEPNPEACADFGGCPFRAACGLTQRERLKSIMTSVNDLRAAVGAQHAAPQQPPVQQPDPAAAQPIHPQYVQKDAGGGFVVDGEGARIPVVVGQDGQFYPAPAGQPAAPAPQAPAQQPLPAVNTAPPAANTQPPAVNTQVPPQNVANGQPQFAPTDINQPPAQQPPSATQPPAGAPQTPQAPAGAPQITHFAPQDLQQPAGAPAAATGAPAAAQTAQTAAQPAAKGKGKGNGTKGRPAKTLDKDEQVALAAITATMSNPNFKPGDPKAVESLNGAMGLALAAFNARFGAK